MGGEEEHVNFAALRICVFAFLLIEISSRKAVPEVTSAFPGPLHKCRLLTEATPGLTPFCTQTPSVLGKYPEARFLGAIFKKQKGAMVHETV